jgi:hypothetical protein
MSDGQVTGNVGIGSDGTLNLQGSSVISGIVYEDPIGTTVTSGGSSSSSHFPDGIQSRDLSSALSDAMNASIEFKSLTPTSTIASSIALGGSTNQTFSAGGTLNVIDIHGSVDLEGTSSFTFTGSSSDYFILNIDQSIKLGGTSSFVLSGGLTPENVIVNVLGPAGQNGVDIESGAHGIGTFLDVNGNATIHGGSVSAPALTGALISGGDIELQSTPYINGAPSFSLTPQVLPVPLPPVAWSGLLLLGGLVALKAGRSGRSLAVGV